MLKTDQPGSKRGPGALILLILGVAVLFTLILWQVSFNLDINPRTPSQTLVFAAVSALIFLLFIALTFVLLRHLLKLSAERRVGVLGSKFRSRMVVGALILSVIPVFVLFLCAYGLMNRSIERWFNRPVEELLEDSNRITDLLSHYALDNARAEAQAIAEMPETQRAFATANFSNVINEFRVRQKTLQGGFALALSDGYLVAGYNMPEAWGELRSKIPLPAASQPRNAITFAMNGRDYIMGSAPVGEKSGNQILVAIPLPAQYRQTLNQIEANNNTYRELSNQRKKLRLFYTGLLLLITMIVLFAATWLALFLSKLVTRPVVALATATQEISRGHLDYRVDIPATDELGELVTSFNRMAAELESSRHAIEASSRQVTSANVELEQRRRDIETILETIPTGVLTLDGSGRITRANRALIRVLAPIRTGSSPGVSLGATLGSLFQEDVVADLEAMMRKADRMGSVTSQMEVQASRISLDVAVTVAALHHSAQKLGYVVVFEDLSDLLKAQKQAAWREVARRIAHEIKNPLTPIALSAERIRRHLERGNPPDEASLQVIASCSDTIADAVETVRTLVDEFSTMARFPTSQPQPSDINAIIQSALSMFNGRLEGIQVSTYLAPDLPPVMADPNAMKRVIANIVDNAADAMHDSLVREVHISTALIPNGDMVEIVIADTGHGVSQEVKEKLFLPYFSTKKRGTGLGLAIVGRIVEDHHGSVRVEENSPIGARFIVELPVAVGAAPSAQGKVEQPDHA